LDWSPEQIAGWLKRTYPEDECNRVSHEGTSKNAPVNDGLAMDADVLWFRRGFVGAGSAFPAS
jgi:hypothetical protein